MWWFIPVIPAFRRLRQGDCHSLKTTWFTELDPPPKKKTKTKKHALKFIVDYGNSASCFRFLIVEPISSHF